MKLTERFRRLTVWKKLGTVAALVTITTAAISFWPSDDATTGREKMDTNTAEVVVDSPTTIVDGPSGVVDNSTATVENTHGNIKSPIIVDSPGATVTFETVPNADVTPRHAEFKNLTALVAAANPDLKVNQIRQTSAFYLVLRYCINACKSEATQIFKSEVHEEITSLGARISPAVLDSMLDTCTVDSDGELQFLSLSEARTSYVINCESLQSWLGTAHGETYLNTMYQLQLLTKPGASSPETDASSASNDKYVAALETWEKLQHAEEMPSGPERSRIMAHAVKQKWDMQIVSDLEEYLLKSPGGEAAKKAEQLLSEVKRSKVVNAMTRLRPVLEKQWTSKDE